MKQNDILILLAAAAAAYYFLSKKPAPGKKPVIVVNDLDKGVFVPDSTQIQKGAAIVQQSEIDFTQPYVYGRNVIPKPKETVSFNKVAGGFMLSGINQC